MTWTSFHRRGEILRTVTRVADERLDGALPMDVTGVRETFDAHTLLGALQLRWHTRLAGRVERELMYQPMDLESAVVRAWHSTADELPGVRAILDHYREQQGRVTVPVEITPGMIEAGYRAMLAARPDSEPLTRAQ